MIMSKGVGIIPTEQIPAINRTGATLTVGGVYALDLPSVNSNSTDAESNLSDLVATTAANMSGILVVALAATLADQPGTFGLVGRFQVLVDGTVDVVEGDSLVAQIGSPNLRVSQSGEGGVPCAKALAALTTNAGTLTDVWFDGRNMWKTAPSTQAFSIVADSATLAGDVITTVETQFAPVLTIPANTLKVGDVIRITAGVFALATNSTDTFKLSVRMGTVSTTLVATGSLLGAGSAVDLANSDWETAQIDVTIRTIGASGTLVASGTITGKATPVAVGLVSTAVDTTVAQYIGATMTMSGSNAGDTAILKVLRAEILHA